jgi:small subunit ribosomal protein S1
MEKDKREEDRLWEDEWTHLEACQRSGKPYYTTVLRATRESITVEVGGICVVVPWRYGFVSAQVEKVDPTREKRAQLLELTVQRMPGSVVQVRVVEVDRSARRIVLAQYTMTKEEQRKRDRSREAVLRELRSGDVRRGVVSAIGARAVTVDIDGFEGRVSRSEMSWERVEYPGKLVRLGQEVDVMIFRSWRDSFKLSMRWAQPQAELLEVLRAGEKRDGRVIAIEDEGAFIDLGGVYGFVPTSQIIEGYGYIGHAADVWHVGQVVRVMVMGIDWERKRVELKLVD